ncbi:acyl-CoA thioesterase domain-containing protein [Nocardia rhizosphaerae]|uniref:Acyl-CoA thioesterase domain-containing protein n=1 Tax=Nocardia rhizosphaerae TaxID=1691571 RepID=A0ABV8LCS9_9NOCA
MTGDHEPEAPRPYAIARPYFRRAGAGFAPTAAAASAWGPDMLAGPAVLGLLARTIDTEFGDSDFFPTRLTADLFRSVRLAHVTVTTRIIRWGNRIRVVEADLCQAGEAVARASAVYYRASADADGTRWTRTRVPQPPPRTAYPGARLLGTSGDDGDWLPLPHNGPAWHNAHRKRLWATGWSVLDDEPATPFAMAAMAADLTNLVTNMGTGGLGYINGDVTLALTRLPAGHEIGLEADSHRAADGIAVSSATLFDRAGVLGECTVTGIANRQRPRAGTPPGVAAAPAH